MVRKRQKSHYNGYNEPSGRYKPLSTESFAAINAITLSRATRKRINSGPGYIKPPSSGNRILRQHFRLLSIYQSLFDLSIGGYLASATPVSFLSTPCLFNKYQSSSIGIDKEHTDEVTFELHQQARVGDNHFQKIATQRKLLGSHVRDASMNLLVSFSLILQNNDVYLYYLKNNAYF